MMTFTEVVVSRQLNLFSLFGRCGATLYDINLTPAVVRAADVESGGECV